MTEWKHTPGPWRIGIGPTAVMACGQVDTYDGSVWGTIARTEELSTSDAEGRFWEAPGCQKANARLISAAPEMLSLIEFIRQHALVDADYPDAFAFRVACNAFFDSLEAEAGPLLARIKGRDDD